MGSTDSARMKVLLLVLTLTAGLGEALKCFTCDREVENCIAPTLEECKKTPLHQDWSTSTYSSVIEDPNYGNTCVFYQTKTGNKKHHGCIFKGDSEELAGHAGLEELDDHDKKCKNWLQDNGVSVYVCYCNYDGCNENMANHTSLAFLTLLASLMLSLTI